MKNPNAPVRVLIVDDSAVIRELLSSVLSADPGIEVVGTASDPFVAREQIKALNPDVVTLDVEMPHMDGVTFLRKIMTLRPMPVVMVSTLTQAGAETTLEALEIGAVDFVAKPTTNIAHAIAGLAEELQTKVKAAARMRVRARRPTPAVRTRRYERPAHSIEKIVAIGASTGGVEALKAVLMDLPANCPPILITQHMPPRFTAAFAERLNRECPMAVYEAAHNQIIEPGSAYIAPGAFHLELGRNNAGGYFCRLTEDAPVSGHRPSVDVLFRSVVQAAGRTAVGVILTGMGKDGAQGMLALRQAGAYTLGQDEESSLIYGMPKAAFECGAVMRQSSLGHMADAILDACEAKTAAGKPAAGAAVHAAGQH
jgi:two-component system chemotaxis response regulator CheB